MKSNIRPAALLLATTACGWFISCKPEEKTITHPAAAETAAMPDEGDAVFKDNASEQLFQSYSRLRTALVNSDANAAKTAAAEIKSADPAVSVAASAIASSSELKAQRASFQALVAALVPLFQKQLASGKIHIQHCPMAMAGKGAEWISESTTIRNPYYGSAMLDCGEVTRTLTPAP